MTTTTRPAPVFLAGYCWELEEGASWKNATSERWECILSGVADGEASYVGRTRIDGMLHNVFLSPSGRFLAQSAIAWVGAK